MNDDDFIATGKIHMLWVGINRYESPLWPTLKNAVSGSEALEGALQANFGLEDDDVVRLVNHAGTLADIEMAIRAYGPGGTKGVKDEDQLIISFAGHGEEDQLTGETAFIPYDGNPNSPSTWFRFDHLRPLLNVIPARHILVISDSCFSGGVFRGSSKREANVNDNAYAQRAFARSSRLMISSGGSEPTSDSGGRPGRSVFVDGLIHSLNAPETNWLLINTVFHETRSFVVSNAEQTPEFGPLTRSGHAGGELVLFPQIKTQIPSEFSEERGNVEQPTNVELAWSAESTFEINSEEHTPPVPAEASEPSVQELETDEALQFSPQEENAPDAAVVSSTVPFLDFNVWNRKKLEIRREFGHDFELQDEVDIVDFREKMGVKERHADLVASVGEDNPTSAFETILLVGFIHFVYTAFNVWIADFLTLGTFLFPLLILIPLLSWERRRPIKAFVQATIIYATSLGVIFYSGSAVEGAFGIGSPDGFMTSSDGRIRISLVLEMSTALCLSLFFYILFRRRSPLVRLTMATSIAMGISALAYYMIGYGTRFDALGSAVTQPQELVPILGFGTPVEKHINWFVRDSLLYALFAAIFAWIFVAKTKRSEG